MAAINFAIPTTNPKIFIPDIPAIVKFANGDLGIADKIKTGMLFKNISKMSNPQQLKTFLSLTGSSLKNSPESYFQNGKIKINQSDIQMGNSPGDLGGLKALEKSLIQSIFETQKPHIEIVKLVAENLIRIEDIIARVLAVGGSSAKPIGNPTALGYKGGPQSISTSLSKLDVLSKLPGPMNNSTGNNSGLGTQSVAPTQSNPIITSSSLLPGFVGITESIVYSTGIYDPNVKYDYTYIYEYENDKVKEPSDNSGTASVDPTEIDDSDKPNVLIMGVYDENWTLIPDSDLYNDYDWVLRSKKYFGSAPFLPYYDTNSGLSVPTGGVSTYSNYYNDYASQRCDKKNIIGNQKQECLNQVSNSLTSVLSNGNTSLQENLLNLYNYSFLTLSYNNTYNLSTLTGTQSVPYSPFKVNLSDWINGYQNGIADTWIDPESMYDMKIIVCNPTMSIQYHNPQGGVSSGTILAFITNELKITMDSGLNFSIDSIIDGNTTTHENIPEFVIDNTTQGNNNFFHFVQIKIRYYHVPSNYQSGFESIYQLGYMFSFYNYQNSYFGSIYQWVQKKDASNGVVSGEWQITNLNVTKFRYQNLTFHFDSGNKFQYVEIFNGDINNYLIFKSQYVRNNLVINTNNGNLTNTSENILNNQIRVSNAYYPTGLLIDSSKITNDQLAVNTPYSKGPYGTPFKKDDGTFYRQNVEYITRYQRSSTDTKTIYIIEGVLSTNDDRSLSAAYDESRGINSKGKSGGGDYHIKDSLTVMNVFIDLLIDIFSKTIPSISQLISIIKNPSSFIVEILKAKIGDNNGTESPKFGFFSKHFLDELKQLSNKKDVADKKDFVKNKSTLKNYVHIKDNGEPKFLLDGVGTVKLFGSAPMLNGSNGYLKLPPLTFGMKSELGSLATNNPVSPPINLIFDENANKVGSDKTLTDLSGMSDKDLTNQIKKSLIANSNLINPDKPSTKIKISDGTWTDVSIEYSTGVYESYVNYTYIYVTEYVGSLVKQSEDLVSQGKLDEALQKLSQALDNDTKNQFIKDKIKELEKKNPLGTHGEQPIFSFLLNLVMLPVKVVFGIISYILNFLKSLTNPFELATKIVEFVSFKWMIDLFDITNENSMFRMANLQFDIPKFLTKWLPSIKSGTEPNFDLSEVMKVPWIPNFPIYSLDQMKNMIFGLKGTGTPNLVVIKMLTGILGLMEGIINGFIDFIWGLFGLSGLFPPPHLRLTKNTNEDLSPKDIIDILNGQYFAGPTFSNNTTGFFNPNNPGATSSSNYNFVYEVKTSDGRDIKNLDEQALADFMEQNKNLQFFFN